MHTVPSRYVSVYMIKLTDFKLALRATQLEFHHLSTPVLSILEKTRSGCGRIGPLTARETDIQLVPNCHFFLFLCPGFEKFSNSQILQWIKEIFKRNIFQHCSPGKFRPPEKKPFRPPLTFTSAGVRNRRAQKSTSSGTILGRT